MTVRTERGRCLEEPHSGQGKTLTRRLLIIHIRFFIIINQPLHSSFLRTAAARIYQGSTRERDAVDKGEIIGTGASSICTVGLELGLAPGPAMVKVLAEALVRALVMNKGPSQIFTPPVPPPPQSPPPRPLS
jgi:hypothetical protein